VNQGREQRTGGRGQGAGGSFLGQVFLIRQIFGILKPKPLSENLKLRSIIENILNYLSKA
jgi:hypothetical protein